MFGNTANVAPIVVPPTTAGERLKIRGRAFSDVDTLATVDAMKAEANAKGLTVVGIAPADRDPGGLGKDFYTVDAAGNITLKVPTVTFKVVPNSGKAYSYQAKDPTVKETYEYYLYKATCMSPTTNQEITVTVQFSPEQVRALFAGSPVWPTLAEFIGDTKTERWGTVDPATNLAPNIKCEAINIKLSNGNAIA